MRTITYTGTLRAQTSIAHGSKASGNNHPFRRETFILPTGKRLHAVPVVSGGAVRGSLRRVAAAMTQQAIAGDGTLPHPVVHALRTGGSLRETRTGGDILTGERQAILRDAIPMFGIFGLAAGGRIMSGRLQVGKPLPVAKETMHLADHYQADLGDYEPPSIWEVIQRETYTRQADVNDSSAQLLIDDIEAADRDLPKGSGNMIYQHETISPGTLLFHTLVLDAGTASEASFFDDMVRLWSKRATIGGQVAKGLGQVEPQYSRSSYDILGDPAPDEDSSPWREHMAERADQIKDVLTWL